jgi:tagatose 6-phosphate kinase
VVDGEDATAFNELGPLVSAAEWQRFLAHYDRLIAQASAVTLSGSTPPGLGVGAYATLVRVAKQASVPVVLDAAGPAMSQALGERPTLVAPNRSEASATLGRPIKGLAEMAAAATELRARGAMNAVISNAHEGLVCLTDDRGWFARPSRPVSGNPTGAGDALTAALAYGLVSGGSWPAILRNAVGWAAGAVACDGAGEINEAVAAEMGREAIVEELQ